jgi:hypothetical protein
MTCAGRIAILAVAAAVLVGAAWQRGGEYDEQYTRFLIAGNPRPAWPVDVFAASDARPSFDGQASLLRIAQALRQGDVHPPLYFWAVAYWRALVGPSLFGLRMFSVLCALASLLMVGAIAGLAEVQPIRSMLLTTGCYGFVYTGAIARAFALAQALSLGGVWLLLLALRHRSAKLAVGGGMAFGAAGFTNYLAVFVGGAALAWLVAIRVRLGLAALAGFGLMLPADLWFLVAQRNSRIGQFPPFELLSGLERVFQYLAANLFGGLPVYVSGPLRLMIAGAIAALLCGLACLMIWRWHIIARLHTRTLLAMAAIAPPLGLLALGVVSNSTPIELRYLSFAVPFVALLLAGTLGSLPGKIALSLLVGVLAMQTLAIGGLLTRPETMQPARQTARIAVDLIGDGVVLLPRGNDGVGVVGAFVGEVPGTMRLLLIDRDATAEQIRTRVAGYPRVVLALLAQDDASRGTLPAMQAAFIAPCWRLAANQFNVRVFDRVCERDADVLRGLHADNDPDSRR